MVGSAESLAPQFQSTPPRRRRRFANASYTGASDFNPRLREGGDRKRGVATGLIEISIHASAKEATMLSHHHTQT